MHPTLLSGADDLDRLADRVGQEVWVALGRPDGNARVWPPTTIGHGAQDHAWLAVVDLDRGDRAVTAALELLGPADDAAQGLQALTVALA